MHFADLQIKAIMHQLLLRYRWSVPAGYTHAGAAGADLEATRRTADRAAEDLNAAGALSALHKKSDELGSQSSAF